MPTSIQLTPSQVADLQVLRTQAEARGNAVAAWADFYSYLARTIRNTVLDRGSAPVSSADVLAVRSAGVLPADQLQSLTWLVGGVSVNSDTGAFSQIIREYNVRQGQLRGRLFGPAALQAASNEVARRMAIQILGNATDPGNGGRIPTVTEIGLEDLDGVRDVLYPGNETSGSMHLNQAWPGIVMLGAQGQDFLGRLLQPNAPGTAMVLDTLEDVQNLLFAWESFSYSWRRLSVFGATDWRNDVAIMLGMGSPALFFAGFESMTIDAQGKAIFHELIRRQNPDAAAALSRIVDIGSERFLDMLLGAVQGRPVLGTTTEANFVSNVGGFFGQLSVSQQQALRVELLPTSAAGLAGRALGKV